MRLQEEARTPDEARAQNYVDAPDVVDPSVITLNAIGASHAVNTMLLSVTGLLTSPPGQQLFFVREGNVMSVTARRDPDCPFCGRGPQSVYGRGGPVEALPVRRRRPTPRRSFDPRTWLNRLAAEARS